MSINLLGTLMVGFSPLLSLTLRVKVMKRGWPLHITSSGKNKDLEADESALTSCTGSVKLLHPILGKVVSEMGNTEVPLSVSFSISRLNFMLASTMLKSP
jgi:hypothetical protein